MKKSYKFKFSPLICVLAAIINILFLSVIVVNTLKLIGVGTFNTVNFALDLSATILSIVLMIFVDFIMFASGYFICEKYLLYLLGPIFSRIKYEDIIVIRQEKTTEALVVNYKKLSKDKDGEEHYQLGGIVINIPNKQKAEFISALRDKNSSILYELIDKELDKKDGID